MRIVFMGTPEFAVPSLQALIDQRYNVVGVFTQPDRPVGRGRKLTSPPVKVLAQKYNIPVYQPQKIRKDGIEVLKTLKPDVCVTVAFGQILSKEILDIPPFGTINVHASLLPKHRGCAPIQYAILQGERETGITTMLTDVGIDTGDILLRKSLKIEPEESAEELAKRLAIVGAETLLLTLEQLFDGRLTPIAQIEAESTYDPLLTKEMGKIDFSKTTQEIVNQVRALIPWPGCYVDMSSGRMKVWKASKGSLTGTMGQVPAASLKEGLVVGTQDGSVVLEIIQMPNCARMDACAYLQGNTVDVGENWGHECRDEER